MQTSHEAGYTDVRNITGTWGWRWKRAGETYDRETEHALNAWNRDDFTLEASKARWYASDYRENRSPIKPGVMWLPCRTRLKWWEPQT